MGLERPILQVISPYVPGKPISETAREYGLNEADVVKLASNENPLGASPRALEAILKALPELHLYPDAGGFALRQKLAQIHNFPADGIILGNGSTELVELLTEAFLELGWEAITGPQAFFKYRIACQIMGVAPVMVAMPDFQYDVEAIIQAITAKTKLIFIANPNNPTGGYLPREQVVRVLGALPRDAILVLDEAYFEFVERNDYPNGLDYVRAGAPVVVLRTFSKAYGLAGVRCGYAFTQPRIARAMHQVREAFNCNALAQIAATAALDDQQFLKETIAFNRRNIIHLENGLKALGLKVIPSVCNFLLVDFQRPIGPIFTELLKRGVIIRPMQPYDLPTCARISVGLPEEHEKLFKALKEIL